MNFTPAPILGSRPEDENALVAFDVIGPIVARPGEEPFLPVRVVRTLDVGSRKGHPFSPNVGSVGFLRLGDMIARDEVDPALLG